MDNKNKLIILLVILASGLGYFIYTNPSPLLRSPSPSPSPSPQPSQSPAMASPILNIPGPNVSSEEYKKYINAVADMAEDTDVVEIKQNCVIMPQVLQVGKSRKAAFKNSDTVEHTLIIAGAAYRIAPAASEQISLPSQLKGIEGYSCLPMTGPGASGILFFPS